MLDEVLRLGFLVLGGLMLVVAAVWYVGFLYREVSGTGPVVIDPFTVVEEGGKGNDELGKALAQMLQARLESLVRELADAQAGLTTSVKESELAEARPVGPLGGVGLWTNNIELKTGLLQPIEMKLPSTADGVCAKSPQYTS